MIEVLGHPVFDPKFLDGAAVVENANKYVYHYTRWERLLDIAQSGFRLGPLASMNDPRESKDWYFSTGGPRGVPSPDAKILDKEVADYKARVRIGSFSKDSMYGNADNVGRRGYGHPRMWAQYAGNHTGVCVIFDRRKLDSAIRQRYPVEQNAWIHCAEVEYIESARQDPANHVIEVDEGQDVDVAVKNYFLHNGHKVFFTKHIDWKDEQECRWVYYDDSGKPDTKQSCNEKQFADVRGGAVAALVLGADFADAHLPVAQRFAEVHHLKGDVVKCLWEKLSLSFIRFADNDGSWAPVQPRRGRMHLSSGPALES